MKRSVPLKPTARKGTTQAHKDGPAVGVAGDGLYFRRMLKPLLLTDAERQAQRLNALPTILNAWLEVVPQAPHKRIVCWLPGTDKSTDKMAAMFMEQEMGKAEEEGAAFRYSPTALPGVILCFNPKSNRSYRLTRAQNGHDVEYSCQCPRYKRASVCKHTLAAILAGAWEATPPLTGLERALPPEEFQRRRAADFD